MKELRYFCTAGKGMEQFLVQEVISKLSACDVEHIPGKVFFTTSAGLERLRGLKSAERLFLLLKKLPPLPAPWDSGKMTRVIQEKIIGELGDWQQGLSAWLSLQQAAKESRLGPAASRRSRKRKRDEETGKEEEEEEGDGSSPAKKQDLQGSPEETPLPAQVLDSAGSVLPGRADHVSEGPSCPADVISSSKQPLVSFRVCCRCSGILARKFSPQELGRIIGMAIHKRLGWKADLREPDLEVNVHLSDAHCILGFPVFRLPLAHRPYIRTTGLRSTTAWAMASLAAIKQDGCFVLDPMCGVGTILIEAAKEWQNAFFLGIDINESQLKKARENIQFSDLTSRIELMKASVTEIPLPAASVDAVICDIPFGRKFGCKTDVRIMLPAIVKEMERVLRVGGTLVLLLSPQLSAFLGKSFSREPQQNQRPAAGGSEEAGEAGRASPRLVDQVTADRVLVSAEGSSSAPMDFPSLVRMGTYRVSLGVTDGLVQEYKKGLCKRGDGNLL
nr:PREDICTED: THUMP domain-containing protein 2 isoform X1 [Lepisosteus oculatus]XP_015218114.1 PREDICTED: THUMP domain-containing protein 2 isoform X1 [Lepisosteus oculatus]XP_015218115.1 PREDICTED: THUMP domain-containing protein 2 isoform X1 [Lepisosteus oculatus]XP_015218116.1 PREDICTED: THUMP domain-containing protein 2 isoform X1 [Lepisosteus oculatus]XP_015218117.1 PREDICTED: THUMP domain-containing protein 2 isoform X1 [Lepisosteus oculatus]